jgi:hypothetical protein
MDTRGERSASAWGVKLIVVVEPFRQLVHDDFGGRHRIDPGVIAFDRQHEGLGHAVALRALDRRCQQLKADL